MRISKDPEVRKQEIIDTAMKIFAEKGFEAVTMKDIAQEVGVATGLCYHYFQNKQSLYEAECIHQLWQVWHRAETDGTYAYAHFFHKEGNEFFHAQLDAAMAQKVIPYLEDYLRALQDRDALHSPDPASAAKFIINGQMSIINDQTLPLEERFEMVRYLILKVLKYIFQ